LEGLLPVDRLAFDRWDFIIKPLVMAKTIDNKITLRVSPALVPKNHPLAAVRDENNALALYLSGRVDPITKIGKGAGAIPTARSVVRDILNVSKKSRSFMLDLPEFFKTKRQRQLSVPEDFCSNWYLRFTVGDEPGVFGKVSTILGEFNLSIKHVLQEDFPKENAAYIMLEIKTARLGNLQEAIKQITGFPFVHNHFYSMVRE
jgi:homoserine dehydrogenase